MFFERFLIELFYPLLQEYVKTLESRHTEEDKVLSFCELNLEIWRQLWRVLEISDIVLVIVDARNPVKENPQSDFKDRLLKSIFFIISEFIVSALTVQVCQKYVEEGYDFGAE